VALEAERRYCQIELVFRGGGTSGYKVAGPMGKKTGINVYFTFAIKRIEEYCLSAVRKCYY